MPLHTVALYNTLLKCSYSLDGIKHLKKKWRPRLTRRRNPQLSCHIIRLESQPRWRIARVFTVEAGSVEPLERKSGANRMMLWRPKSYGEM